MNKLIKKAIATVLAVSALASLTLSGSAVTSFASASSAAASPDKLYVRVNSRPVAFPDAQPYIDENDRTLIPVRFVAEELGATVGWEDDTSVAVIEKNGINIRVPIGHSALTVNDNGSVYYLQMDTVAILNDGRTYVPIRFVAETLGAYVAWSEVYNTVSIYADELTASEIATLREYPYTQPQEFRTYEEAKYHFDEKTYKRMYDPLRDTFGNFENAHLFVYTDENRFGTYGLKSTRSDVYVADNEEFGELVVKEAKDEINYESNNLKIDFRADTSCLHQPVDCTDGLITTVRGYVTVTQKATAAKALGAKEVIRVCSFGITQIVNGNTYIVPVDVHMATSTSVICIDIIVPLGEAIIKEG